MLGGRRKESTHVAGQKRSRALRAFQERHRHAWIYILHMKQKIMHCILYACSESIDLVRIFLSEPTYDKFARSDATLTLARVDRKGDAGGTRLERELQQRWCKRVTSETNETVEG